MKNRICSLLLVTTVSLTAAACANRIHGNKKSSQKQGMGVAALSPGNPIIRSEFKPGELTQLCKQAMDVCERELNEIVKIPVGKRTFGNTTLAFEDAVANVSDATGPLAFMKYVSTDKGIHAEGADCETKFSQYAVSIYSRKGVYEAIKGGSPANDAEKRLLSETLKSFENNGLKLADAKLAKVLELKQKLAALESDFSDNLNSDETSVEFEAAELKGVPADFLARLKKTPAGKLIVTTKSTDYTQVAENAISGETRRKILLAYNNRAAGKNVKLLEDAIVVREQIAAVMGYQTWADYKISLKMAKDSKTVMSFLNKLKDKLIKRSHDDLDNLLAFKKEQDPSAKELNAWDISYLSNQVMKRDYQVDEEVVRPYFPADVVIKGMFEVYSKLLGVNYVEVKDAKTWSEGVKLYAINDTASGQLIGYFYADFIPRPGKYGHAAAFPLISGRMLSNGYSKPVSSIVANFNPPANGKPSLLNHYEVETVFHEFGHIMHQTLTRAPYASLSGSGVTQDFVEAPSQMLENWVWSPEILTSLSGHYEDHSKKLPAELLEKMIKARDFNQGYHYVRQLMLASLDMKYHTSSGPVDTTQVQNDLYKEMIGIESIPDGHFQAGFGHLMGGYDAGYYGYLWSEVHAADMFTVFQAGGLLDPNTGMHYRKTILEQGNMVDALDLLKQFLGREPNDDAFSKKLHIEN